MLVALYGVFIVPDFLLLFFLLTFFFAVVVLVLRQRSDGSRHQK
jgi:hypothetical protein